ncbi:MAG: class I SAM-dependent methyltransferase [Anaerolineae bacterium]|nr:class I SAM-dependent methyltransferase [Anaerolineae bacterium]MDW8171608.1 class I SAM-dependent methyltransferase [Anaerolineae bacterium]
MKKVMLRLLWALIDRLPATLSQELILRASHKLDPQQLRVVLARVLKHKAQRLSPDEALRLLFSVDHDLYVQEGEWAVRYGGGLHTKHRHTKYHDFFVERIQPNERVLDIGCGVGALAHSLATRSGARVLGIDISEKNISQAKERYAHPSVTYQIGDAPRDLPQQPFDVVVLSNVLEHIPPSRSDFLRQVHIASQAQRFLIRVPLYERDWRVPLMDELGLDYRLDPTHYTEYTLESFKDEMKQAGLRVVVLEVRWGEIWSELVVQLNS